MICRIKRPFGTPSVVRGLALTPADCMRRTEKGLPIQSATQSDEYFLEGSTECSYDVPLQYQRGIDINTTWEEQMSSREHFRKAGKYDKYNINIE